MIKLGQKARDKITGFEGVLIGRYQSLTGPDRYGIAPMAKDGQELRAEEFFDEARIELIGDGPMTEARG